MFGAGRGQSRRFGLIEAAGRNDHIFCDSRPRSRQVRKKRQGGATGNVVAVFIPYHAHVQEGGKQIYLGMFATAEEAALVVGRRLKSKQSALPTKMDIEDTSSTSSSTKSIASSSSTYVIGSGKRKAIDQMQRKAFEPSEEDSD